MLSRNCLAGGALNGTGGGRGSWPGAKGSARGAGAGGGRGTVPGFLAEQMQPSMVGSNIVA